MPFDGVLQKQSLVDIVRSLGKEPISPEFLRQYKKTQLEKNAGSWLYRHREQVPLILFAGLLGGVGMGIMGDVVGMNTWVASLLFLVGPSITLASCGCIVALIVGVTGKKPAKWRDHYCYSFEVRKSVHPELANFVLKVVQTARQHGHDATIIIGELYQETVMIDPYVVVRVGNETVCLGIWDRLRVIKKPANIV